MSSHIAIVESLTRAAADGEHVVLATVVHVVGSSYGGVGARMVIRVDGSTVGLVSGGCLESDLCAHAVEVHASGNARVVTYDTRADDDAVWGLGLGCNGLIDVLLQPLPPKRALESAELLRDALALDEPSVIATVVATDGSNVSPAVGAQALFTPKLAKAVGEWRNQPLESLAAQVDGALATGRRGLVQQTDSMTIAFEVVNPAVRLLILGSGPDAAPVCRLARALGWNVTLVDHRPINAAHASRFPDIRVVECADAYTLASCVDLGARTAAVVMSHHFARDAGYVGALIRAGVGYIGVLGPRTRTERMLAEIAARGGVLPTSGDALFAPVGLDLGGDGPESIALAIVAEVSAVMHGRTPGHLREHAHGLHEARR